MRYNRKKLGARLVLQKYYLYPFPLHNMNLSLACVFVTRKYIVSFVFFFLLILFTSTRSTKYSIFCFIIIYIHLLNIYEIYFMLS